MTRTAYLRVYQPIGSFPAVEREAWLAAEDDEPIERAPRGWLIGGAYPALEAVPPEGAFVRHHDLGTLVCPWRTRLRMLVGLLAFRGSVPDEVADAFVPEEHARRAAYELARLEEERPEVRSHIVHSNWHVPLRWFAAFDESERVLTEDRRGLRIRYQTPLSVGRARLERAMEILEGSLIDESMIAAVRELGGWLGEFLEEGILELDYGSVAQMFSDDELVEDTSAAGVWACLESLEGGDVVRAGRIFGDLTERWTDIRAREIVN